MSLSDTLAIGNFALSNINSSEEIVSRDNYGGICFRVALAFAFLGASLDCLTVIGKEKKWDDIIQKFADNRVNLIQNKITKESLRFDWFYENGNQLNKIKIHNSEIMNLVASSADEEQLQKYSHIILCSLGLENEKSVMKKMNNKTRVSYIFHESNLNNVSTEDYLGFFEGIDNLFINEEEAYIVANSSDLQLAGEILSKKSRCFITLGKKGSAVFNNGKLQFKLPAVKTSEYNAAGAGDTYAGGVLAALSLNFDLRAACRLGSLLASVTVNDYLTNNLQKLLFIL